MIDNNFLSKLQAQSGSFEFKGSDKHSDKTLAKMMFRNTLEGYLNQGTDSITVLSQNIKLLVDYLYEKTSHLGITTLHSHLDTISLLPDSITTSPLHEVLQDINIYAEKPKIKIKTKRQRNSILRSLAEFVSSKSGSQITIKNYFNNREIEEVVPKRLFPCPIYNDQKSRERIMILNFGVVTGLRIRELIPLRVKDVKITDCLFIFIIDGKGGKDRTIQSEILPLDTIKKLKEYVADKAKSGESTYLFSLATKKSSTAYENFRNWLATKGIWEEPHSMRRYFANRMRVLGYSIVEIANALGHSSILTTLENYLTIFPAFQRLQLIDWNNSQDFVNVPQTLSRKVNQDLNQFMSMEGFIKFSQSRSRQPGSGDFTLGQSVELLRNRILRTFPPQTTKE